MITFLNLETVISQLVTCPPLSDSRASNYDVDLAETVAKLVNTIVADLVKILETENQSSPTWAKAEQLLAAFLPHLLRFFSDVFDEVCSTVLTAMNDVLAFLRRTGADTGSDQRAAMLLPIIKAIFTKMRYDDTADWNQEDEQTDEAEFQDLRKRLASLQSAIAGADERLYIEAISTLVHDTLQRLRTEGSQLDWRDLDLALHEVYLLGDLAGKGGGLYQKNKPNSPGAEKLIQLMLEMVQSSKLSVPSVIDLLIDLPQMSALSAILRSSCNLWKFVSDTAVSLRCRLSTSSPSCKVFLDLHITRA
jgi:exportin-T